MSQRTFKADLADYFKRAKRGDPSAAMRWERLQARHGLHLANWRAQHPDFRPPGSPGRPKMTAEQRRQARAERKRSPRR